MLHVRSNRPGAARTTTGLARRALRTRVALWVGELRDAVLLADPGLLRLQLSLRGVLSVVLTTALAALAASLGGFTIIDCASGITLSMMGPFLSSAEPTRAQRQRTLLALLVPAAGATIFTAALHGHGTAGDSIFLLLVFLCFLLAPRSPRGVGYGLVVVVIVYVGLYLNLPVASLPIQIASQVLALPVVALACFVLVPVNPAATLRRTVAAVQARAAQVIRHAETPGEGGSASQLRRDLLRLNAMALAADDQIALLAPAAGEAVRARLVEVELWSARLVDGLDRDPEGAVRRGAHFGLHARRVGRAGAYATRPGQFAPGTTLEALVGIGSAVHALSEAVQDPGAARAVPRPPVRFVPGPLAWRTALRATAAAGLAMAGGMALSPQRWFWAVITVYVVFLNARTRGDTIYKGVQRLAGTVLGIAAGLVLATALAGDTRVELLALVVSVFGMFYFFLASYTIGIFFVTILLGILYGMLGASPEALLVLRLEETAIGAAAAMVTAAFILPNRTRDQIGVSGRAVLGALAASVRASGNPASGPAEALAAMRPVDRAVGDLRLAVAPVVAGQTLLRRNPVQRSASALVECVHWTRMLAAAGPAVPPGPARDALAADAAGLADQLTALANRTNGPPPAPLRSAAADPAGRTLHGLAAAIVVLAERMELGSVQAFAFRS